jgi:hypothetical protein
MRIRSVLNHSVQAVLEGALIAMLVVGLMAGTALAGKSGGGGGGHGGGGKPGGTLTAQAVVAPNPVPAYSRFSITGCGYKPSVGLQFTLYAPDSTNVWGGSADANGCLVNASGWANAPGSARLDVLEGSVTRVASTTFEIK